MDISVIIPNYNGAELIKKNLPEVIKAVSKYKGGKTEVIIIDDASLDNSLEIIGKNKSQYPSLVILQNKKNHGFASSVNKAVEASKGEIVILLNTDVRPEESFLAPLISNFDNNNVFAVGALDKSIENNQTVLRGRGLGEWKRGLFVHRRGEVDKKNTLLVSGGSGAFRKVIWQKLGGFNLLYSPFYWEDIDLSYRALKSGYKLLFESKSIVIHEHEKGSIKSKYTQNQIDVISYRNQFIFAWENATDLSLQVLNLFWIPYHLTKAIISGNLNLIMGFMKALVLFPKIVKSSLRYQRSFVIKDSEVIKENNI